jgi:hypothetical protein
VLGVRVVHGWSWVRAVAALVVAAALLAALAVVLSPDLVTRWLPSG